MSFARRLARDAVAALPRRALRVLLPSEPSLAVLLYHRVVLQRGNDPFSLKVTVDRFGEQLRWISARFPVLPLERALEDVESGTLPGRHAICISFDDGYRDNRTRALPILDDLGLLATLFLATAFVEGGRRFWWDRLDDALARTGGALPRTGAGVGPPAGADAYRWAKAAPPHARDRWLDSLGPAEVSDGSDGFPLSPDEVREVSRRLRIGGHGHEHASLGLLAEDRAESDIAECVAALARLGAMSAPLFAYPFGGPEDVSTAAVEVVRRRGFLAAFTTSPGVVRRGADPMRLPRIWVHDESAASLAGRLVRAFAAR